MVNNLATNIPYMRASGEFGDINLQIYAICDGFLDGGRTRIRTRVAGLEGQSDIQLHYTSIIGQKYLFHEL